MTVTIPDSNQLWNISGVPQWAKVYSGLVKMYRAEVLTKFPVIQHTYFGSILTLEPCDQQCPRIQALEVAKPGAPGVVGRMPPGPGGMPPMGRMPSLGSMPLDGAMPPMGRMPLTGMVTIKF